MKHLRSDAFLFIIVVILIIAGAFFVLHVKKQQNTTTNPATTQHVNDPMLQTLAEGFPEVTWGEPTNMNQSTGPYGELPGRKITGTIKVDQANIPQTEDKAYLESQGFKADPSMSADGPGSSVWGYSKGSGENTQVVIFSYEVKPTSSNPNEPLQFNCPCNATVSIFVSDLPPSAQSNAGLANPASVNCKDKGGTTQIMNGPNGQYGLCQFADNQACEEWALYRGECPVGGVKTTGFDNIEQKYCAWVGGQTLATPNANCTLPNGKVCSNTALYNGTCSA
jgi:putative hemolysin